MSGQFGGARLLGLAVGLVMLLVGLAFLVVGGPVRSVAAWWLIVAGGVVTAAVLLERTRYRSDATDRRGEPVGPAGGEPSGTHLEPRFKRSDEVFADPTTGQRMRVWIDPATGERRYLAEG
jgi:hypothetical protein